jgi:hypothetical protein
MSSQPAITRSFNRENEAFQIVYCIKHVERLIYDGQFYFHNSLSPARRLPYWLREVIYSSETCSLMMFE